MHARVYYQDFYKNISMVLKGVPNFEPDKAVHIGDFFTDAETNEDRLCECEQIFARMNRLNVPVGHPDRDLFVKAGHTSMSVGDYIQFDDGQVWYCARNAWLVRQASSSDWVKHTEIVEPV